MIKQNILPSVKKIYELDNKKFSIGIFYQNLKKNFKKNFKNDLNKDNQIFYEKLSTNIIFKEDLDKCIKILLGKNNIEKFEIEEKLDILVKENILPSVKKIYEIGDKKFCIGTFYQYLKKKNFKNNLNNDNKQLYEKLSENIIFKDDIDKYIKKNIKI